MLPISRSGPYRFALGLLCLLAASPARPQTSNRYLADNGKPYIEVAADAAKGFNYPYLLFTPPQKPRKCFPYMIVEQTNGGLAADDPQLTDAIRIAARVATHVSDGNEVAQHFGAPLLVPVFPRPPIGADSDLDIFSLSRAALLAPGRLKRVDLQLAAMIADAQRRLRENGRTLDRKVALTGFSGSGLFASRFVFLHPDMVLAAAFGGLNSFIMLPVAAWQGNALEYPLGLADYKSIIGHDFDRLTYDAIPQLAYQGENDDNDAVPMDDEYTIPERDLIWKLFGKKMYPDRWQAIQAVYRTTPAKIAFKVYTEIGHGDDQRAWSDIAAMFSAAAQKDSRDPASACE